MAVPCKSYQLMTATLLALVFNEIDATSYTSLSLPSCSGLTTDYRLKSRLLGGSRVQCTHQQDTTILPNLVPSLSLRGERAWG